MFSIVSVNCFHFLITHDMDKMCSELEAEDLNNTTTNVKDTENFKSRRSPVFKCFNNAKPMRGNNLDSSDYDIPSYQVNQSNKSRTSSKYANETSESVLPFSPIFSPIPVASSVQFQPPSVHTLRTVAKNVERTGQDKVNSFSNSSRAQTVKSNAVFESLGMNDKDISWVSSMATPPPKNIPGSEFNTVEKATFFPEEKFQNIQPRALFSPTVDDDFGCHPIVFTSESDGDDDDEYKSNIRLSDVCATLKQLEVKSLDLVQNNSVDFVISPIIKTKRKKLGSAKKKKKGSLVISPENTDKYEFAVGENLKASECEKVKSSSGSNFIEDDSFQSMSFSGIDELCKTLVSEQSNNSVASKTVDCDITLISVKENSVKKFYFTKTKTDVFEVSSMENLHSYAKALEEGDKCNQRICKTNQTLPQTGIVRFDILNNEGTKVDGAKRFHSEITEENDELREKKLKTNEEESSGWDNVKHYLSESQLNVSDGEIFRTVENLEKTLASQGSEKLFDENLQGVECASSQNSDPSRACVEIRGETKEEPRNEALKCSLEVSETRGINNKDGKNSELFIPSVPFVAFTTASGSKISVSEKALSKAREILKECDESNEFKQNPFMGHSDQPVKERVDLKPEQQVSSEVLMKGFSTGSGKQIKVSAEALKKARTLMSECEVPESEKLVNQMNIQTHEQVVKKFGDDSMGGFFTGSGKQIPVSDAALEKAKTLMSEFDDDVKEHFPRTFKSAMAGFSTDSGKNIQVSAKALEKATSLMAECEGSEEDPWLKSCKIESKQTKTYNCDNNSKENLSKPRHLVGGLAKNSGETSETKAKSITADVLTENPKKNLNIFKGFSTCSGKQIQVSTEALEKAKSLMVNCERELKESSCKLATDFIDELDNKASDLMESNTGDEKAYFDGRNKEGKWGKICFSTASGNTVKVSKKALEKGKELWAATAENIAEMPGSPAFPQTKPPVIDFTTAGGRKVTVSEAALAKVKERMGEWEQMKAEDSGNFDCISNLKTSTKGSLEILEKTAKLEENQSKMSTTSGIEESDEWDEIIPSWLHVYNTSPSIASERTGLSPVLCHEDGTSSKPDREYIIRSPVLGSGDRFHGKKRRRKLQFEDGTKAQEKGFVVPFKYSEKERKNCVKRTSSMTLDFSVPFKKMKFVKDCEGTVTCSNIKAKRAMAREQQQNIIKEKQKVQPLKGSHLSRKFSEKQMSWKEAVAGSSPEVHSNEFLRSFGIREDVLRITIENAVSCRFKGEDFFGSTENIEGFPVGDECLLILDDDNEFGVEELKRAFLASPGVQPNLVSPGWVENHLKWIIWKLANYEKCFPQYFGGTCLTPNNLMLQLKYRYDREIDRNERSAIKKILERDDTSIKRLVLCICDIQKVIVGESVGYKLTLTDGWYSCPAQTDPAMTRLIEQKKLRIGTKLVTQGAILVNCEQGASPLEISGDVYLKISTNSTRRIRWDAKLGFQKNPENFPVSLGSILPQGGPISRIDVIIVRIYPILYMEKTSDGRHVTRNRRSEEKADSEYRRIQEQRMESICNEIQSEELIPADQRNLLEKLQPNQNDRFRLELREKIEKKLEKEKLNRRNVSEFLRAKIVDFRKPDFNNPAILTVWNPNEDLTVLLSEGKVISLMNVTISNSSRVYKPLQINTTRQTQYRQIVRNSVKYPARKLTRLKDVSSKVCPAFEEVDVVGMVALIRDVSYGSRMSQVIYLTDFEMNYVGIVFWGSSKDYGWENVLRTPSIVACSNLQWKKNYTSQDVPSLYVNENSVFTENPKQMYLKEEIERLKQSMPKDKAAFLSSCEEDLTAKLEDSKWLTNNSKNSSANDSGLVRDPQKPRVVNGFESKPTASSTPIKPFSSRMDSDEAEPSPIQKRIEKLQSYGEPPSLIPLLIRNNAKRKFKKKS